MHTQILTCDRDFNETNNIIKLVNFYVPRILYLPDVSMKILLFIIKRPLKTNYVFLTHVRVNFIHFCCAGMHVNEL